MYAMLMSFGSLLKPHRSLGLDTRVLRLNWDMFERDNERSWASPFIVSKCIRVAVLGIRAVGQAIERCTGRRSQTGEEEAQIEPKNADEYRKTLENTFGEEGRISFVMLCVRGWTEGG